MGVTLHGIPNCDTVKKARAWLAERGVDARFRDFKKDPPTTEEIGRWADSVGWEALLNRRGTTFRALPNEEKEAIDRDTAIGLMARQPSLIKRPVIERDGAVTVGWTDAVREGLAS